MSQLALDHTSSPTLNQYIRLVVLDAPAGKGRPRFVKATGGTYTPKATRTAEGHVRAAWDTAGQPRLPENTAIDADVTCYLDRPQGHYTSRGELSAEGQRNPFPARKKPDVDNAAKLVLDALEKYAYPRDVAITDLTVRKRWTDQGPPGTVPCTVICLNVKPPPRGA